MSTRPDTIRAFHYTLADNDCTEESGQFLFVEEHDNGFLSQYEVATKQGNIDALLTVCPYISELLGSSIYEGNSETDTIVVYDRYEDGDFEETTATWLDLFEDTTDNKEIARFSYHLANEYSDADEDDAWRAKLASKYTHKH